eukprot:jgi/Mesen1/10915/ME000095S10253
MAEAKVKEAEELLQKAEKLITVTWTRWSPDWLQATPLYEQAALRLRQAKRLEQAIEAYERAAYGQERIDGKWQAAKHMETAGSLSHELKQWRQVADFYRRASTLYLENNRLQPAAEALARGAKLLEEADANEAGRMYAEACHLLEDDSGPDYASGDIQRAATSHFLSQSRYKEAAAALLRAGLVAHKAEAAQAQGRAYTGALVVYLYAQEPELASKCFHDCSQVAAFYDGEFGMWCQELLDAYRGASADAIAKLVANASILSQLDPVVARLAKKLPIGNLEDMAAVLSGDSRAGDNEDPDDLT